jgi:hypothetical protein
MFFIFVAYHHLISFQKTDKKKTRAIQFEHIDGILKSVEVYEQSN